MGRVAACQGYFIMLPNLSVQSLLHGPLQLLCNIKHLRCAQMKATIVLVITMRFPEDFMALILNFRPWTSLTPARDSLSGPLLFDLGLREQHA